MKRATVMKRTATTTHAAVEARERPMKRSGMKKKHMARYASANQRYSAVVLPRNLAALTGTMRIGQMTYQMTMPVRLKSRGEEAGDARADVRAEHRREHALDADHADAHERRERGGGDGGRLDEDGDAHAGEHGEVARGPAHRDGRAAALDVGHVAVDGLVQPDGDAPLEQRAERVDDEEERDAQSGERADEGDDARGAVGDAVGAVAEDVLEHVHCPRARRASPASRRRRSS